MTQPSNEQSQESPQVLVVGPDGMALGSAAPKGGGDGDGDGDEQAEVPVTEMVEQPAKVMRIGSMIKQLLEEVKAAPLDEASRVRLKEIHTSSIKELEDGLAPELIEELERLSLPFADDSTPTDAELRIAQAQLVGWLEGLFHGIQTALFAQQMAARAQLEQMRRALPPGAVPEDLGANEAQGRTGGPYL
ncbi:bacterial proteasome activator family protein [Streptomyces sp. NBC_01187]|uniref:bacterial proteasome activator family protein n=1 Tax=Streptomyces sp. NBC_01187 TaxID=2903766 RepID=UPI003870CF53|nr:bacterial proteasome activator family protein [Streptomyces sp. NBC_01187]